ncbi:hypothetical protein BDP55DRAFT_538997 [Colletotrichum godetiae]|uniref:Uncharacterized protein n=1 Tax=Colletotrichum godetiae TaxID=1209918 RepID=A0AAJ0B1W6_9PEZI|nr:uncharacterized protein BDP55DRAFT_538997 [Colletotrichum godetiae]KAK1701572.1 hypothetical protein BDP55DRAFT_538997 [Colletotrichum godetiae]
MSTISSSHPGGANWVEQSKNPLPQVVVYSAPEAVSIPMNNLGTGIGSDGTKDGTKVHAGEDDASENDAEQGSPPEPPPGETSRLWNWKTMIGICIGLLILAIVVPLTVTLSTRNHTSDPDNTENLATSSASSPSSSPTTTSLTSLPAPSSTLTPVSSMPYSLLAASRMMGWALDCVESKFIREVNWLGIDKGGGGWLYNLYPAKSAQDCCTICHLETSDGCNGWMYIPENSSTPSCSIIHGFDGPSDSDSCPKGRPDVVFTKAGNKESYGGPGPCAGSVRG